MKKLVCELCGSNDFTKDNDGLFVCDYCRTKYTPEQAQSMMVEGTVRVDRSGDVANLITIATNAFESGNYAETYDYANRALEIDPKLAMAWYLKGAAAGWSSTLNSFRVTEMVNALKSAMGYATDEDGAVLRQRCAAQVNSVAISYFNNSRAHLNEFANVDGTWEEHVARCQQVIGTLQTSYEWDPIRQPLDNIIMVASNLLGGTTYQQLNASGNVAMIPGVRALTKAQRRDMQLLIDATAGELRKFDPSFVTPKPKTSPCFVVTATMGRDSAPPVVILRDFRDTVLIDYGAGRKFIGWYYTQGPRIADTIAASQTLRLLSFVLVVAPSTAAAWIVMRLRLDKR